MISFIPKFCSLDLEDAKVQVRESEKIQVDFDAAKGEYIFLLDRSLSMEGNRIVQAKTALVLFLRSLPVDCYFNVISFGRVYQKLTEQSQKNSTDSISFAINKV